jgi:hypothetical protein
MSRVLLFALIHSYTNASPIRIPLIFNEYGDPYVNARVEGLFGSDVIPFRLSSYLTASNRRPFSDIHLRTVSRFISLISPDSLTEITRYSEPLFYVGSRASWNSSRPANNLGVGPRSTLSAAYGSVDFVNVIAPIQSGFLELGNPYENFEHHFCQPGTIFNVSVDGDDYARGYIESMGSSSSVLSIDFMRSMVPRGVGEMGSRIELPNHIYENIISMVRRESDLIVREPTGESSNFVFESCERVRNAIGPINIYFLDNDNPSVIQGRLLFEPTDFTQLVGDDACELLISNGYDGPSFSIDVLMMKDVNIRFTRNQITFCDTSL